MGGVPYIRLKRGGGGRHCSHQYGTLQMHKAVQIVPVIVHGLSHRLGRRILTQSMSNRVSSGASPQNTHLPTLPKKEKEVKKKRREKRTERERERDGGTYTIWVF